MTTLTQAVTSFEAQLSEVVETFTTANDLAETKASQANASAITAFGKAAEALTSKNAASDKAAEASGHANAASSQADLAANAAATTQTLRDSIIATQGSIGYLPPVAYTAGLAITLPAQTVSYSGQAYAPLLSALPFTTSGTFETAKFRLIQGVAAVDLAAAGGAGMVGHDATLNYAVGTIGRNLRDGFINVRDFPWLAKADGVTDDSAAITAADAAANLLGKRLYFPASTSAYFIGNRAAPLKPSVTWQGESSFYNHWSTPDFAPPNRGSVIDAGSANMDVLAGGIYALSINNLTFKGSGTGAHISFTGGSRQVRVFECSFHGKAHAIKVSGTSSFVLRFERLYTARQTSHALYFDWADKTFNDISVRDSWIFRPDGSGVYAGGTTGGCTLFEVSNNSITDGAGNNAAVVCNLVQGFRIVGNDIEGWGATYDDPVNLVGKNGYLANACSISVSAAVGVIEGNVTYGGGANVSPIRLLTATNVRVGPNRTYKNLSTQFYGMSVDSTSRDIIIEPQTTDFPSVAFVDPAATGSFNAAAGYTATTNRGHVYLGASKFSGSVQLVGPVLLTDAVPSVVAANVTTLPDGPFVKITGSTGITTITGKVRQIVILQFQDALTVYTTGNLRLAGNFVATPNSTLTLMSSGTVNSWFELSRAVI